MIFIRCLRLSKVEIVDVGSSKRCGRNRGSDQSQSCRRVDWVLALKKSKNSCFDPSIRADSANPWHFRIVFLRVLGSFMFVIPCMIVLKFYGL
ncbi:unnamed protein product [Prunus armeniaca]